MINKELSKEKVFNEVVNRNVVKHGERFRPLIVSAISYLKDRLRYIAGLDEDFDVDGYIDSIMERVKK